MGRRGAAARPERARRWTRPPRRVVLAVAAFVVVHVWLVVAGVFLAPGVAFNDLYFYRGWVQSGASGAGWPVLDTPWVYPLLALVPMLVPAVFPPDGYVLAWCVMIATLDLGACVMLLRRRGGVRAVWWWSAFLLLLGPVAIARLDAVVVPLVVIALLVALDRPAVASLLLTVGAWIKVAPAAMVLPLLAVSRRPWVRVVMPAAALSAGVVGGAVMLGADGHAFSFLGEQGSRGLQIEAPAGTPWLIDALFDERSAPSPNSVLNTWEIAGPGTSAIADLLGVLLPAALLVVGAVVWWRRRTLGDALWERPAVRAELLARGALLAVLTTLVFNKVGSPQFMCWLAAPLVVAVALTLPGWRAVGALVLVVAGATQLFFPWFYEGIPGGWVGPTIALVVRNAAVVVLWVLVFAQVARRGVARRPLIDDNVNREASDDGNDRALVAGDPEPQSPQGTRHH